MEQGIDHRIDELESEICDLKQELRDKNDECDDLYKEKISLEEDVDELRQIIAQIEGEPKFEALNDETKYELFMDNYQNFTLEQFENFLNSL